MISYNNRLGNNDSSVYFQIDHIPLNQNKMFMYVFDH